MKKLKLFSILCSLCSILSLSAATYDVADFGAVGNGRADDTRAVQQAIRACSEKGGGTVLFTAGHTYLCGPLELLSDVCLYLEPNSRLLADPREEVYRLSAFGSNEGEGMMWLYALSGRNISIAGRGTIDGNGIAFMGPENFDSYDLKPTNAFDPRPHVLTLIGVEGVSIRDVTIGNSAYWTIHLVGCRDALIEGVRVNNSLKVRNSDGIDLDHCSDVRVANCFIESGDDSICLKNRREYDRFGHCQDIVVENCTMTSRSCAIKIGSENVDSIRRVLFNNCVIKDSNRGVGIQNRDEGTVTDVVFSNMVIDCRFFSDVWWGKSEPIYVTAYPRRASRHKDGNWRFPAGATEGSCGEVSRVWFKNILCTSENGVFVGCDTPGKVSRVTFADLDIDLRRRTDYPGGVYDRRPCLQEEFIASPTYGFYLENASDVLIRDCSMSIAPEMASRVGESFVKEVDCNGVTVTNPTMQTNPTNPSKPQK